MQYLSPLVIAALLGFSSAAALPEPIHINIDVEALDEVQFQRQSQHMRPDSNDPVSISHAQQVVKDLKRSVRDKED